MIKHEEMTEYQEKPPEMTCKLAVKTFDSVLATELSDLFGNPICQDEHGCIEVDIVTIDTVDEWEVGIALVTLFESNAEVFSVLYDLADTDKCEILVVIAFCYYCKYPALIFDGKNMEIIRKLKADITIVPSKYKNKSVLQERMN